MSANLDELEALWAAAVARTKETWTLEEYSERDEDDVGEEDVCHIPETLTEHMDDYEAAGRSAVAWQVAIHNAFPRLAAEIRTLRDEREKTNARLASVSCVLQDIVFEIFDQRWDEFEFEQYELGKRARIALGNEDVGSEA